MAPPSPLAIATGSVQRLVKEEGSYHKELASQETRLQKLLDNTAEDENKEYLLKQERTAIEETKAVFPPLRERIADALAKLEDQLETAQENEGNPEEITKAKDVVAQAKTAVKDS
ncbi:tubulin-specific chaperone Rbl2 [Phlyctema vagabunda]|uniref:Tubulin-specific chaperone A n=1 Tax=Phlyctema vagabunda TaxID=108571 RepID=A0ABR4P7E2_9HELO